MSLGPLACALSEVRPDGTGGLVFCLLLRVKSDTVAWRSLEMSWPIEGGQGSGCCAVPSRARRERARSTSPECRRATSVSESYEPSPADFSLPLSKSVTGMGAGCWPAGP